MTGGSMTEADYLVREMAELGAMFSVVDGYDGRPRWHWQPASETMRDAIRRAFRAVDPRPSDTAIIDAIGRLYADGRR